MNVLIACEESGTVRDEFAKLGHNAWSCDLQPSHTKGNHYQGDVFDIIGDGWDLMIAHPPCTYLTVTGNKWFKPEFAERFPTRHRDREDAVEFFLKLYNANIPRITVEQPVSIMSSRFRPPDQYIQPYFFGDPHRKKTGLWLKGLPLLKPTNVVEPRVITHKNGRTDPVWHYETRLLTPEKRSRARSKTFPGFAKAMAQQWGNVVEFPHQKTQRILLKAA